MKVEFWLQMRLCDILSPRTCFPLQQICPCWQCCFFSGKRTGITFLRKEVALCFPGGQRTVFMQYWPIPYYFKPSLVLMQTAGRSSKDRYGPVQEMARTGEFWVVDFDCSEKNNISEYFCNFLEICSKISNYSSSRAACVLWRASLGVHITFRSLWTYS